MASENVALASSRAFVGTLVARLSTRSGVCSRDKLHLAAATHRERAWGEFQVAIFWHYAEAIRRLWLRTRNKQVFSHASQTNVAGSYLLRWRKQPYLEFPVMPCNPLRYNSLDHKYIYKVVPCV